MDASQVAYDQTLGSEAGVTIYAFRNNFATQVSDVRGKDVARKGMGHMAGNKTFDALTE